MQANAIPVLNIGCPAALPGRPETIALSAQALFWSQRSRSQKQSSRSWEGRHHSTREAPDRVHAQAIPRPVELWRVRSSRSDMRREALCCIPGAAGRNSKEGSWVRWLTQIRKVKGTSACQQSDGHAQVSGLRRCGTRVIWRKLDCLNPNLQTTETRRPPERHLLPAPRSATTSSLVVATFGAWSVAQ